MKIKLISLALASAFTLTANSAVAEGGNGFTGTWYVMPGIGMMHPDSDLEGDDKAFPAAPTGPEVTNLDFDLDSTGVAYSLRLGKELSEHWDVQLGFSYAKVDSDTRLFNTRSGTPLTPGQEAALGLTPSGKYGGDYKQYILGVDALYMFSRSKFRPFLLAGLGAARNEIDYGPGGMGDDKTSWMANVGAGFQYHFTDVVGIQADVREVWSRAKDREDVLF
ncbi:MAG: porin family protein, partial [Methylobacillus sp.]|nr:porin family protein [Methylobacillus sp.]